MSTRNPNLLLIFDELAYQLMLYGRHPIDYMYDFNDEENPKITAAFERAFDLYNDSIFDELDQDQKILLNELCGDEQCRKRLKLIFALGDYIAEHRDNVLDAALWERSPILQKYPKIQPLLDEDFLFDTSNVFSLDHDKIQYEKDVLFYHPFIPYEFRREFDKFYRSDSHNCKKKIALDPRRILPAKEYPLSLQEAYWYGPKFNLEKVDAAIHGIELTVHLRPIDSLRNLFSLKLDKTEFMWSKRGSLKTLQIEEIVQGSKTESDETVTVRYIHTIRDIQLHAFIHLDGAIRSYLSANYSERLANKLSAHPNSDGYFKLFRIDGTIPDQDWVDLIAKFFSGNELIHEYFGQPMPNLGTKK
jgi:hypothetical protein